MKQFIFKIVIILFFSLTGYISVHAQGTEVNFNTIPKSGTVLVYAHQDDDVIWMLPFWNITEKFIDGAMPSTSDFRNIVRDQQAFLNNHGYNINYEQNWITPWTDITPREYYWYYGENAPAYSYLADDHLETRLWNDTEPLSTSEINKMKAKLEQYISSPSVSRIITHNNWGEYGHQHHKAVNLAVRELAVKYRKDVWMLGCNNGNFINVNIPSGITYTKGTWDTVLFAGIRSVYQPYQLWTWSDTFIPRGTNNYIKVVDAGNDKSHILTGEQVTVSGPDQDEPGTYIFDGVDDYMTLTGNRTVSFTIAMKVRPAAIRRMDISKMSEYPSNSVSDRNFYLNSDGTVSARIYDGSSKIVTSTTPLTEGNWTHIVMTGNGSSLKIYINGLLENTIPAGSAITSYATPEFVLGETGVTSSFFSGQINDVKLYDRALTDTEIAELAIVVPTINASAGTGGAISPAGVVPVATGSDYTFNITPGGNYLISDVKVDNVSMGALETYTFNNVSTYHTISATFIPKVPHTITATAGDNGAITPSGEVIVAEGTDQTFTIDANAGYRISNVLVDDISVGAVSTYTFSNVSGNHTISATFSLWSLTITSSAASGGTISPTGAVTVDYGTSSTFIISPDIGFTISRIRVDNVSKRAVSTYTFRDVTANHTISATFTPITYTITSSAGRGGSITPQGAMTVNYGTNRTYSITPDPGYYISDVLADNISAGPVSSYTFNSITANHTISATFALYTFTLTGSAGSGGLISPSGSSTVNWGSNQTYAVAPNTGFSISDVEVDNISVGAVSSYTFSDVTSDHTISASFKLVNYKISGTSGPGGSITPAGTISIAHGSDQTYIISPSVGFEISDVIVDGNSSGAISDYSFTAVTGNHTISATFSVIKYSITAIAGNGGSVSPDNEVTVDYGTDAGFIIAPDEGYYISDVIVDNNSVGIVDNFTFTNVTSDHTISVLFAVKTYTISATSGVNGLVTPGGETTVNYGTIQVCTITPDNGYRIADVRVDDESVGAISSYTFDNVVSNHTISASFEWVNIYSINATAGQGGSISPKGIVRIPEESNLTCLIKPDKGYRILKVIVDDLDVSSVSEYTFNNIYSDHSISAEFTSETVVNAYPSPFRDEFKVKIETPLQGKFDLYIFDVASRIAYAESGVNGNEEIKVNLQSSPTGLYIIRLYYEDVLVNTIKVIKF